MLCIASKPPTHGWPIYVPKTAIYWARERNGKLVIWANSAILNFRSLLVIYLVVCSICWYIYIQEWSLGICSILDLSHDGIYQRHTDLYRHLEVIDTALTRNPKQLGNQIEFSVLTELQQTGWHGRMAESWNMQIWSIFINEQWQLSGIWGSEIYWNCRRVKNVQIIWT